MKKVRNAIVGLGRIGSSLEDDPLREKPASHAGAVRANPECVLVGGCDLSAGRRSAFAKRWNCRAVFTSLNAMLEKTSPDILHIATPPETHLELVRTALKSHIPVVICEKPLAHTRTAAYRIAAIHRSGELTVLTNHERRYSEDYRRARRIVSDRRYGSLSSVTAKLSMERGGPVSSLLWDDGTHLVDAIHFLTSRCVRAIRTVGDSGGVESFFILGYAGTVPVVLEAGTERGYLMFEIDLLFSRGRVRIGNGLYEEYEGAESGFYERMRSLRNVAVVPEKPGVWPDGPTRYFSGMLEDAVACFRNRRKPPVSSAVDGYLALAVIDRALRLATSVS
jgi:predicted dehydrogenase